MTSFRNSVSDTLVLAKRSLLRIPRAPERAHVESVLRSWIQVRDRDR